MRHANIIGKIAPHIHGTHAAIPFIDLPDYVHYTWIDGLKYALVELQEKESSIAHEQHAWDNHFTGHQHSRYADNIKLLLNNLPKEALNPNTNTITITFTAQAQSVSDYLDARRKFDETESIIHAEDPHHVVRDYVDDVGEAYFHYQRFIQWLTLNPHINNILQYQRCNIIAQFYILPAA